MNYWHLALYFFCLKQKMLNKEFGGTVTKKDIREDGQFKITLETSSPLFRFVYKKNKPKAYKMDKVTQLHVHVKNLVVIC